MAPPVSGVTPLGNGWESTGQRVGGCWRTCILYLRSWLLTGYSSGDREAFTWKLHSFRNPGFFQFFVQHRGGHQTAQGLQDLKVTSPKVLEASVSGTHRHIWSTKTLATRSRLVLHRMIPNSWGNQSHAKWLGYKQHLFNTVNAQFWLNQSYCQLQWEGKSQEPAWKATAGEFCTKIMSYKGRSISVGAPETHKQGRRRRRGLMDNPPTGPTATS